MVKGMKDLWKTSPLHCWCHSLQLKELLRVPAMPWRGRHTLYIINVSFVNILYSPTFSGRFRNGSGQSWLSLVACSVSFYHTLRCHRPSKTTAQNTAGATTVSTKVFNSVLHILKNDFLLSRWRLLWLCLCSLSSPVIHTIVLVLFHSLNVHVRNPESA